MMSGRITDPPHGMPTPSYFLGICDVCTSIKTFSEARTRDQWESHHPPQENYTS
jgi:hypothetical protein